MVPFFRVPVVLVLKEHPQETHNFLLFWERGGPRKDIPKWLNTYSGDWNLGQIEAMCEMS